MLTHVDVFLGVAMVMLAVSLLLTIVTQVISLILNLRGKALRNGLAELFDTLKVDGGKALAEKILKYKLVADAGVITRLAPAVTRADFLRLLDAGETLLAIPPQQKAKIDNARKDIEAWFDLTMTRVAHRFTLNTRAVTVVAAFVAAFLIHLDSFGLVTMLYKDSDMRARMAGAAGSLVAQGQQVLTTPSAFSSAATTLATENANDLPGPVPVISTRAEAEGWIRGKVHDDTRAQALLDAYDQSLANAVGPALKTWLTQAGSLKRDLDSTSFRLIPEPYRPFDYDWASFLGVFVSACLLSLGAPFWFNALKTVSNLRPTIAAQVDAREPKDREAAV